MIAKSCARTVLRPFSPARAAACWMYQPTMLLRPSSASPAVLQPALLIIALTFDDTSSISVGFAPPPPPPFFFAFAISSLLLDGETNRFLHRSLRENRSRWQKNGP